MSTQDGFTEGMRFEYEMLRGEILQNMALAVYTLAGTLVFIGILIAVALSQAIPSSAAKAFLFLLAELTGFVGLRQTFHIDYGTLEAATYLRVFLEPYIDNPKWETRLDAYRKTFARNPIKGITLGFLDYFQVYRLFIWMGFLGMAFFAVESALTLPQSELAPLTLIGVVIAAAVGAYLTLTRLNRLHDQHAQLVSESGEKLKRLWEDAEKMRLAM